MEIGDVCLQELYISEIVSIVSLLPKSTYLVSSISDCRLRLRTHDSPRRRHRMQGGPSSGMSQRI